VFILSGICNSTKYVSYKDIKVLMSDLKEIYAAVDEQTALDSLERFADNGTGNIPKYPSHGRNTGLT